MKGEINLAVLPGDGIGREVTDCALEVFNILNVPVNATIGKIGWDEWKRNGDPIPAETWRLIKKSDATLIGATTSKPYEEALNELPSHIRAIEPKYISPLIQLRQKLDLFANIRPCYKLKKEQQEFDFCIIRENTEGLYAGLDYQPPPNSIYEIINSSPRWNKQQPSEISCTIRLQTEYALIRLFYYAFEYAKKNGYRKVTFADKPNVLRESARFAKGIFDQISSQFNINAEIANVDAIAHNIVRKPQSFGVIVAENMFADILSDVAAAIMGGLGVAPSANIGEKFCYFEPVHGSAPKMEANRANPTAMFLTISMMLKHFQHENEAKEIENAVKEVIKNGYKITYDLGGNSNTHEMSRAIIKRLQEPTEKAKCVAILATGDELVTGSVVDTNSPHFSSIISKNGGNIKIITQCTDNVHDITNTLNNLVKVADAVIITGGLGPTSDDNTREAVAKVTNQPLAYNENAWKHIKCRLNKFGLKATTDNKKQAFFPANSHIIKNENGTAWGCQLFYNDTHLYMLPGPPREALPMFENTVMPSLKENDFFIENYRKSWLTIGLIEGEIAPKIDFICQKHDIKTSYRWDYPFLEIKITCDKFVNFNKVEKMVLETIEPYILTLPPITPQKKISDLLKKLDKRIQLIGEAEHYRWAEDESLISYLQHTNVQHADQYAFILHVNKTEGKQSVMNLYCKVIYKDSFLYEHSITTPLRETSSNDYIQAYTMWQLIKILETVL